MSSAPIGISPEAFINAFPFHIVFDRSFTVLQVGPSLRRALPSIEPGVHAPSVLRVKRPPIQFEWGAIKESARSVFLLDAGAGKLLLRGQIIADEAAGTATFLGSPRLTDPSSLTSLGLSLDDFAPHDAAADLIFLLQSKNAMLADAQRLMAELTAQKLELREANSRLKESEERYALAAQGANDGLWDWKLATGEVHFSPRWKAMLGFGEDEIKDTLDEWLGRVHPDDWGAMEVELDAHLEGRRPHFEAEHRMAHRDGSYRWMLVRGIAVRDAAGSAVRMAGTQTDVTARKQAELALVEAREDLAQKLALLERQDRAIRELSTPILRVWEGVVAVPIIGSLDENRAAQLTERLLGELSRSRAAVAILDLTGAAGVDFETAGRLLGVMRAARLLGSRCVVAGLSPAVARSFAELGVETSGLAFFAELRSALASVFQGLGGRPSRRR